VLIDILAPRISGAHILARPGSAGANAAKRLCGRERFRDAIGAHLTTGLGGQWRYPS